MSTPISEGTATGEPRFFHHPDGNDYYLNGLGTLMLREPGAVIDVPVDDLVIVPLTEAERDTIMDFLAWPTPEEWLQMKAERLRDEALQHLHDRGVQYEDEMERPLDHVTAAMISPADLVDGNSQAAQLQGQQQTQSRGVSL